MITHWHWVRLAFLALALAAGHQASAANVYIDPECPTNGNGSSPNCAEGANGPKNTWVGINFAPGMSYLGKANTVAHYPRCNFFVAGSGSGDNDQIIISSYGEGKHSLICDDGYVFGETQNQWITFQDLALTANSNTCLYLQGSRHIRVERVVFEYCQINAIALDGDQQVDHDDLTIANSQFLRTGRQAIAARPALQNRQAWTNIRITGNTFTKNVSSGDLLSTPIEFVQESNSGTGVQNTISNLEIDNNSFSGLNYRTDFKRDEHPYLIHLSRAPFPPVLQQSTDHSTCLREKSLFGIKIHHNTADRIGGGIALNFAGIDADYPDTYISHNKLSKIRATVAISSFFSSHVRTTDNTIRGVETGAFADYWDGIGVDYDYCTEDGEIARNFIANARGSDVAHRDLNGQGIAIFAADGHKIYSNVLFNNRFGIMFGNDALSQSYKPHHAFNNTIVKSQRDGIRTLFTVEQENVISNNIIAFSGRHGIKADGRGEQALQNNLIFGSRGIDVVSNNPGKAQVSVNPRFLSGSGVRRFRIGVNSPAVGAGALLDEANTDYYGRTRPVPPSIGAFEPRF